MKKEIPLDYRTLQRIKAEEFAQFFERSDKYFSYLNHLGEVKWMTEEEAEQQHEFFLYEEGSFTQLRKKLHLLRFPRLDKLSGPEKEIRLQIRRYLEENYLGGVTPETGQMLSQNLKYELTPEEIENIPVTKDVLETIGWSRGMPIGLILLLLIIGGILLIVLNKEEVQTGSLLVQSNVESARVYLDGDILGYTGMEISNIPSGTHRVSLVKAGYTVNPPYREVEIYPDSMTVLSFQLEPVHHDEQGYLIISADYPDSKIFVDHEYYGTVSEWPVLPIIAGEHKIVVEKDGFTSIPDQVITPVSRGDTAVVKFRQRPAAVSRTEVPPLRSRLELGTLEVTTNVPGARIYINGRYTGKDGDYVFTNMGYGEYRIRVEQKGYRCVPPEKVVRITESNPTAEVAFELIKEYEEVSITTAPEEGDIYVDGQFRGKGKFQGMLKLGRHKISFGEIPGFKSPQTRMIEVKANAPVVLSVEYFPQMEFVVEVTGDGNVHTENCNVATGYTFSNRGFSASEEAGPEIVYHEKLKDYFWKLGFAFPFRNPKGNDALKVTFNLPHDLNYNQKFILKIYAASSREKYPLSLSARPDVKIRFNGKVLSYYYKPKFWEDVGGMEELEWDISSYIKPGMNSLEITTTDKNNTYYYVKRIRIRN
ncbi:MAG: PEGA domain-containing protein [Calditrichaeota bacterium]|nr:MAG: PEGA domain-containing protein [Calditrichota bacterium]